MHTFSTQTASAAIRALGNNDAAKLARIETAGAAVASAAFALIAHNNRATFDAMKAAHGVEEKAPRVSKAPATDGQEGVSLWPNTPKGDLAARLAAAHKEAATIAPTIRPAYKGKATAEQLKAAEESAEAIGEAFRLAVLADIAARKDKAATAKSERDALKASAVPALTEGEGNDKGENSASVVVLGSADGIGDHAAAILAVLMGDDETIKAPARKAAIAAAREIAAALAVLDASAVVPVKATRKKAA